MEEEYLDPYKEIELENVQAIFNEKVCNNIEKE